MPNKGSRQQDRQQANPTHREAIVNLGCRYQLMSSATSFVAIERREEGDKTAEMKLRRVPVALTRGWGGSVASILPAFRPRNTRRLRSACALAIGDVMGIRASSFSGEFLRAEGIPDLFSLLVLKQQFDGSWSWDEELLNAVGWSWDQVTQMMAALGIDTEEARNIIATLLVLQVLQRDFQERQVEWWLLAQKAKQWLRNVSVTPPLMDPEPVDKAERWQVWFSSVASRI
ncbi:MAG: hypothetical protein Q6M04_03905 [Thermostichus sp. BF3_bins_97]